MLRLRGTDTYLLILHNPGPSPLSTACTNHHAHFGTNAQMARLKVTHDMCRRPGAVTALHKRNASGAKRNPSTVNGPILKQVRPPIISVQVFHKIGREGLRFPRLPELYRKKTTWSLGLSRFPHLRVLWFPLMWQLFDLPIMRTIMSL